MPHLHAFTGNMPFGRVEIDFAARGRCNDTRSQSCEHRELQRGASDRGRVSVDGLHERADVGRLRDRGDVTFFVPRKDASQR
jgi:hypothetical protein